MKTKYITFLACLAVLLLPTIVWGADGNAVLEYFKGKGDFEEWFMKGFAQIDTNIRSRAVEASYLGRAIGGFGAMIYLGYLGWEMQEGRAEWSVTPMLRPIFLGLILINWASFTDMIKYPLEGLATPSISMFENIEGEANKIRAKRYDMQLAILEQRIKLKAKHEQKKDQLEKADKSLWDKAVDYVSDAVDDATNAIDDAIFLPIYEYTERVGYEMENLLANLLEGICLTILRVCTYFVFFIQKIWSYILIVLGPIAVGLALIPGFDNSLYSWVAKFININLYTFIAYTIIDIGQQLIMAGYQMEIDRYKEIINEKGELISEAMLIQYNTAGGQIQIVLITCVAYLVTAVAVLMTPTIADSIVSAGGAGVMSKGKRAAANTGKAIATVGRKLITGI
ncbi:hypothetical protein [Ornithobacterium rhinotracheale]|uniref:hypothetical protein n=1 Tax=Ornithobacterium rhinotracheale TaxID=28251 RepID=UPI00403532B7